MTNLQQKPGDNIFVLGSGRSGTSLLAGLFRRHGLFMGDQPYKARDSNPHGFFEDRSVNDINEALLATHVPISFLDKEIIYGKDSPTHGQRWLTRLPYAINTTENSNLR